MIFSEDLSGDLPLTEPPAASGEDSGLGMRDYAQGIGRDGDG